MSDALIVTESPHYCKMTVRHGETMFAALPQLINSFGDPYNLTNVTVELFMRPSASHPTLFTRLTSVGEAGILKDDAANGMMSIFYSEADAEEFLPVSNGLGWWQFMRFAFTDADLGPLTLIFWEGPLIVLPDLDTATPP